MPKINKQSEGEWTFFAVTHFFLIVWTSRRHLSPFRHLLGRKFPSRFPREPTHLRRERKVWHLLVRLYFFTRQQMQQTISCQVNLSTAVSIGELRKMRVYLRFSWIDRQVGENLFSLTRQVGINGQFDSPRVAHLFPRDERVEWSLLFPDVQTIFIIVIPSPLKSLVVISPFLSLSSRRRLMPSS